MPTNYTGNQIKDTFDQILHADAAAAVLQMGI